MILAYGNYALTFAISSSGGGSAFLTSSTNLADARTGSVSSMSWTAGAQTTSSTVTLTVTVADPLDTTAPIGAVGVANVSGLPVGTRVTVNGVNQNLVAGARSELSAWWIPNGLNANSFTITFANNVAGASPILAGATFAVGEIFVGRVISLPSLVASGLSADLVDPTSFQRSAGGQLWQLMRKPYRQCQASLGPFSTANAMGGVYAATLVSGANPAGVIDIRTLREYLATTPVCAVCDAPTAGLGAGSVVNGIRFDQNFMQTSWMVARPTSAGLLAMNAPPLWTWSPSYQEAT